MVLATKVEITRNFVFSKISAADIYMRELPGIGLKQAICSVLRQDKSPSMILTIGESGQMRHKDLAYPDDERFSGGAIDFIMSRYGLNYDQALNKVAQDFCLLQGETKYKEITDKFTKPVMDIKRSCLIQVETRKWQDRDSLYWSQFGITKEQLKEEQVYPLKAAYINRVSVPIEKDEICYVYRFPEGYKLYFPFRKKEDKWKCNIKNTTVEGLSQLNGQKNVIITKSRKDRMVLSNCLQDYHILILNVQHENKSGFTQELLEKLKNKTVYINFDSDEPGVKSCKPIVEEFGFRYINVPREYLPIKDFADIYKIHGKEPILTHLKQKQII